MSYVIAKWYLYIMVYRRTGKWPDRNWRRWVRQSLRVQIQAERAAAVLEKKRDLN